MLRSTKIGGFCVLGYLIITIMSVAMATDAFTVAVTGGMDGSIRTFGQRVKAAIIFGFFQGLFFLTGVVLFRFVSGEMTRYNSVVAGVILIIMGGRSLIEGVKMSFEHKRGQLKIFNLPQMMLLGVVTSIDALAAGLTVSLMFDGALLALLIVSGVAAVLTYVGAAFGQKIGPKIGDKANIFGGLIIILLGIRSLFM